MLSPLKSIDPEDSALPTEAEVEPAAGGEESEEFSAPPHEETHVAKARSSAVVDDRWRIRRL